MTIVVGRPHSQERQDQLDDVLSLWHHWMSQQFGTSKGYAPKSLVVGDFKISRQHDDTNGQLDADLERRKCRAVQFAADSLEDPYRTAIYVIARAANLGTSAIVSPRLPQRREELDEIIRVARHLMISRLVSAGVID
jgi:hypothetical protein